MQMSDHLERVIRRRTGQAMPVILAMPEEVETWLNTPVPRAMALQRPLADDALKIVSRGQKADPRLADVP
jgi:putative SOS response-associated peptidase YedK